MFAKSITFTLVLLHLCTFVWLQRDRGPPDVSLLERQFRVVYEWRTLDFAFKNEQERGSAIFRGEYIPRNVIISDVKPYGNRLYLVSQTAHTRIIINQRAKLDTHLNTEIVFRYSYFVFLCSHH